MKDKDLENSGKSWNDVKNFVQDREEWKVFVWPAPWSRVSKAMTIMMMMIMMMMMMIMVVMMMMMMMMIMMMMVMMTMIMTMVMMMMMMIMMMMISKRISSSSFLKN